MRNLLVGGSLLLASVAAASAADLPVRSAAPAPMMAVPMVYNWSGFYMGLNAGGAWSNGCTNYSLLIDTPVANWPTTCAGSSSAQFTGGAQIGYNLQSGNFVYGLEADVNFLGNSNSSSRQFVFDRNGNNLGDGTFLVRGLGDPGVFGTVRARLGFAADRALFYVTGGLAWASGGNDPAISWWNNTNNVTTGPADVTWRRGGASGIGWTLGAGIEYAITNNWTIRGEYLYVDLGKEDNAWSCTAGLGLGAACTGLGFVGRADVNFSVARVGVNYKFGGGNSAPVLARY
ncbi:MAG: outer membrane beta-barrel protein [Beijerinckiaceae bacterium]|nr:outer membrane beta-barrel protein [Beijerinckiaceae bacterium]